MIIVIVIGILSTIMSELHNNFWGSAPGDIRPFSAISSVPSRSLRYRCL